jgi:TonB-dependent SusC/RagA subfamily outer membrane receptor
MIVPLMLYTMAVGALIAAAALGLEGALRLARRPTRWVWAGAIVLALALVGSAPFRGAGEIPMQLRLPAATVATGSAPAAGASLVGLVIGPLRSALRAATAVPLTGLGEIAARASGSGWNGVLLAGWGALSALALFAFAWTALRYRSIRRSAPVTRLHDTDVRLSRDLGPAVVGLFRHEIVIPRWFLGAKSEEQRLILAHEAEHRRARDPLLLAGGWLAIVLVPWNPLVWWMASRLRLATEMDCDARVLRRGVEPLAYGSLLITIAGRCAGIRVGVSALADSQSHLERRLSAMITRSPRFPLVRGSMLGVLALAAVLAACEASMPTAAEVKKMDVSSLETKIRTANMDFGADADYFVNGKAVPAADAKAIAPDKIAAIRVMKALMVKDGKSADAPEGRSQVRILTKDAPEGTDGFDMEKLASRDGKENVSRRIMIRDDADGAAIGEAEDHLKLRTPDGSHPLIYIDGVAADEATMSRLDPKSILTIDVLKGPSAEKEYGARGANGVVKITTKK